MVQAIPKLLTFPEFLDWKPEEGRYELIRGHVVEMHSTGKHEEIVEFLDSELTIEARRLKLPYRFPKQALIKIPETETGYLPDVSVVDRHALATEPLWQKASSITRGASVSVPLVIEVVSTNWHDDYGYKLNDYEALGISEYWIVDHAALGAVRYIGFPKQPTISIYRLVDDEYQVQKYQGNEQILSQVFPELQLTADQIFRAEL